MTPQYAMLTACVPLPNVTSVRLRGSGGTQPAARDPQRAVLDDRGHRLLTSGWTVAPNPPHYLSSMRRIVDKQPRRYADCTEISHLGESGQPVLQFEHIFQQYPTRYMPVHIGDGLRQAVPGIQRGDRQQAPQYALDLAERQLKMFRSACTPPSGTPSLHMLRSSNAVVPENSLIHSGRGVQRQVGHLEATPLVLPSATVQPEGIVMITPLDRDANIWIYSLEQIAALGRLPTRAEFLTGAQKCTIPFDSSLFMRYDTPHAGGTSSGLRSHCLITDGNPPRGQQSTHMLMVRPPSLAAGVAPPHQHQKRHRDEQPVTDSSSSPRQNKSDNSAAADCSDNSLGLAPLRASRATDSFAYSDDTPQPHKSQPLPQPQPQSQPQSQPHKPQPLTDAEWSDMLEELQPPPHEPQPLPQPHPLPQSQP